MKDYKVFEHILLMIASILFFSGCNSSCKNSSYKNNFEVRGWNILSYDTAKGIQAIQKASQYNINHLQLSHQLIMNLKDVRKREKLTATRKLVTAAHNQGIENVLVWDHALYELDYYPDEFKTSEGLIDLDNPQFWLWLKHDYRSMLDSLENIQGIVLTFIETGAYVEDQHSEIWKSEAGKLANLVDSVASVVIDERGMDLFIRTFIHYEEELAALLACVNLVQHPGVKVMTKEVPHDFFLTHPVSDFITRINKDVLIEFDLGHEFNGQGIVASMLPEITIKRWKYYASKENVIGYVARTDRYHNTQNVGRPTELNLYVLKRIAEDHTLDAKTVVNEFITHKYGAEAVPGLSDVFLETDDIITSVLYTLGLHMNNHSSLDFDYPSIYSRHCSGKWLENPEVFIGHDVNRTLHLWKDVVENLSPARHKRKEISPGKETRLYREVPWVIENGWVTSEDLMNPEYLKYIITEKEYGVGKAKWALETIRRSEPTIPNTEDYQELLQLYERTYLTSKLYLAASKAYFGYRCYLNQPENEEVIGILQEGLSAIDLIGEEMKGYPHQEPHGQFVWIDDVERAKELKEKIINGWDVYEGRKFELVTYTN